MAFWCPRISSEERIWVLLLYREEPVPANQVGDKLLFTFSHCWNGWQVPAERSWMVF